MISMRAYTTAIWTRFVRPDPPLLIDTADLRHPNRLAISAMSSSFALPSTGAAFTRASHVPSSTCSRELPRELGFTLTSMTTGGGVAMVCAAIRRLIPTDRKQRSDHRIPRLLETGRRRDSLRTSSYSAIPSNRSR